MEVPVPVPPVNNSSTAAVHGKIGAEPTVGRETNMATLNALERALRRGTPATLPAEDAERIAAVALRHGLAAAELAEAAADIRDWSRRPSLPVATVVWRVLGDPGADALDCAARLMNAGSTAAV
jgi:hypothetical protein